MSSRQQVQVQVLKHQHSIEPNKASGDACLATNDSNANTEITKLTDGARDLATLAPWYPSYNTFENRVKALAADSSEKPTILPEGFPSSIQGPRVWSGTEFQDPEKFIVSFSVRDISEIEEGLNYFKSLPGENGPEDVTTETFPLPTLGKRLEEIAATLHHGVGFSVLRGLDPTKYSSFDNVLLYLGITSYIAEVRGCQDYDEKMIVHITNMERELPVAPGNCYPSPYSSRAQPFHTDRCDILSMYVLDVAAIGGESLLASSGRIYNDIASKRPDVIHTLTEKSWVFDEFVTPPSWHCRPLLYNYKEHGPSFCYSRRPITGAPFSPHKDGVPAMTEKQAEALDMVHFTAEKYQLQIDLQRGDIEVFNNLALMHGRKGFVDDREHRRYVLRLWLKNVRLAWHRPEELCEAAREIYEKNAYSSRRWDIDRAPPVRPRDSRRMSCS